MELAKEAAIRSAEALRDEDYMGVVAFDSAAAWVAELQQAVNRKLCRKPSPPSSPEAGPICIPAQHGIPGFAKCGYGTYM